MKPRQRTGFVNGMNVPVIAMSTLSTSRLSGGREWRWNISERLAEDKMSIIIVIIYGAVPIRRLGVMNAWRTRAEIITGCSLVAVLDCVSSCSVWQVGLKLFLILIKLTFLIVLSLMMRVWVPSVLTYANSVSMSS